MKKTLSIFTAVYACAAVFGGMRTNDWSWVRGTHYRINGDAVKTSRELGYGKRVGLNAVRFWLPGMGVWRKNPEKAVQNVKAFMRLAWGQGYYSMPILFNGNGLNPAMLEGSKWNGCARYASSFVNALKDEPGLLMWDVMNEPTYNKWVREAPDGIEKERRREKTRHFVRRACAFVKGLDPDSCITLGCADPDEAAETADCVDVLSFHDYSGTRGEIEAKYAKMAMLGRNAGKGVLQSETGCTAYGNGYDMALEACERHRFGWFFFNLILSGYTETFHGVFYDDGTVRDTAAIAAMMGCYRCRDFDRIIPASPVKPGKEYRLDAVVDGLLGEIRSAEAEGKCGPRLFDEMERAANYLESCDLVAMNVPPTARIAKWRSMPEAPLKQVISFAKELAEKLKKGRSAVLPEIM